jgi:hypothetical protein
MLTDTLGCYRMGVRPVDAPPQPSVLTALNVAGQFAAIVSRVQRPLRSVREEEVP